MATKEPLQPLQIRTDALKSAAADMTTTDMYPAMAMVSKTNLKKPDRNNFQKFLHFLDKYLMLIGLAIVILIASQYPIGHNNGPLSPKITSSWMVTIILFFGIGLGVKIQYLKRACLFWQMNLFTHFIVFIYFPLIGYAMKQISLLLPDDMVSDAMSALLDGVVILCCLPATAASAVVFTSNANGNEAAAAINCTLSNLIGIFLTPALILLFMGNTGEIDAADIFIKLSLRVVAPFFGAQIIRIIGGRKGRKLLKKGKPYIRKMNEIALLFMVFCALSESFYNGIDADIVDIVSIIAIIIVLHCHSYVVIWYMASSFRFCMKNDPNNSQFMAFTIYDRIAILYSGASKTIALGIPLIETIYENNDNVGMYIIPILLYKPTCLIVGSLLVHPFQKLVGKERKYINSFTATATSTQHHHTNSNIPPRPPPHHQHNADYGALEPFTPTPDFDEYDHANFSNIDLIDDENDADLDEINLVDC